MLHIIASVVICDCRTVTYALQTAKAQASAKTANYVACLACLIRLANRYRYPSLIRFKVASVSPVCLALSYNARTVVRYKPSK